jgi:biotin carboxylase
MTPPSTLLILAASFYQLDAIHTARKLGYKVITADNVPTNPGHRYADVSYNVDTRDCEGILRIARTERVAGILAPCTDVALPALAAVVEQLGLNGPPPSAIRVVCDKVAFRGFLKENGFACPVFYPICAGGIAPSLLKEDGEATWILKPDASSGSKGIFIIKSEEELRTRLPETLAFSPRKAGVLEEYLPGHQGTCEGILRNGEIAWHLLLDRQTVRPPYTATCAHFLPTALREDEQNLVLETISSAWRKLGFQDGPFDCDFVISGGRVFLLEITPRLGGNSISKLVESAIGFRLTEYAVRLAVGETPPLPMQQVPGATAVLIFGSDTPGQLEYDEEAAQQLSREDWVVSLNLDVAVGAHIRPFIDGRHRIGEAIIKASSRGALLAREAELRRRLDIRTRSA